MHTKCYTLLHPLHFEFFLNSTFFKYGPKLKQLNHGKQQGYITNNTPMKAIKINNIVTHHTVKQREWLLIYMNKCTYVQTAPCPSNPNECTKNLCNAGKG